MSLFIFAQIPVCLVGFWLCWKAFHKPLNKADVETDVAEGAVETDALAEVGMGAVEALSE